MGNKSLCNSRCTEATRVLRRPPRYRLDSSDRRKCLRTDGLRRFHPRAPPAGCSARPTACATLPLSAPQAAARNVHQDWREQDVSTTQEAPRGNTSLKGGVRVVIEQAVVFSGFRRWHPRRMDDMCCSSVAADGVCRIALHNHTMAGSAGGITPPSVPCRLGRGRRRQVRAFAHPARPHRRSRWQQAWPACVYNSQGPGKPLTFAH
jgi:hypothetical protein